MASIVSLIKTSEISSLKVVCVAELAGLCNTFSDTLENVSFSQGSLLRVLLQGM